LLTSDAGERLLSLLRIRDFKKLYIFFPCFYELFNRKSFLQVLRRLRKVVTPVLTFPEFHLHYMIKFHLTESPFNWVVAYNLAITNDDPEAIALLNPLRDVMDDATRLKKTRILGALSKDLDYICYIYGTISSYTEELPRNMPWHAQRAYMLGAMLRVEQQEGADRAGAYTKMFDSLVNQYKGIRRDLFELFMDHIIPNHTYEECLAWKNQLAPITNICPYTLAKSFLDRIIKSGNREHLVKAIQDKIISDRRMRTVLRQNFIYLANFSYEVLSLVNLTYSDLLQFHDGKLVGLLNRDTQVVHTVYNHSILELITDLHSKNPDFQVSSYVLAQITASRDILTLKYIQDHNLLI
jgi:hypothetical protein